MRLLFAARIFAHATLLSLSQTPAITQSNVPVESPVVLEASNIIHGIGHYVGTTLLVRLREDGTVEWEKDLDAYKREKHAKKLSPEDLKSILERLNSIDQSSFTGQMGPFATYTDTFVELKIHLTGNKQAKEVILQNPWPCSLPSCSHGAKKDMPVEVKRLLCEVTSLRSSLTGDPPLISCGVVPNQ